MGPNAFFLRFLPACASVSCILVLWLMTPVFAQEERAAGIPAPLQETVAPDTRPLPLETLPHDRQDSRMSQADKRLTVTGIIPVQEVPFTARSRHYKLSGSFATTFPVQVVRLKKDGASRDITGEGRSPFLFEPPAPSLPERLSR
ncbi:MAG: hypothetical protein JW844_07445 [Candidatus Omnitrophica bacterium]|nr:hypothetical protein [Candidatus Omnitrophota bacterium]